MQGSVPDDENGLEPEKPRRTRNEMIADAFRNSRLPDDWVDDEPEHGAVEEEGYEHDPGFDDHAEPYAPPEPESHRISPTGLKSVGCLVGAIALIGLATVIHLPTLASVVLWLGILALAGGSLYLLNRLVEEHDREFTVVLPGIAAAFGAIVLLVFGHAIDQNLGGFFAFTVAAAIGALAYAAYHNREHFGTGNAVAVTVIELVFAPIAIILALLYFFRHEIVRQVAPGMMSPGSRSANGGSRQMPEIGSVFQSHGTFLVYDENGSLLHQMNFNGTLLGYTSRSFQVQSDRAVFTFDAHCRPLHQRIV